MGIKYSLDYFNLWNRVKEWVASENTDSPSVHPTDGSNNSLVDVDGNLKIKGEMQQTGSIVAVNSDGSLESEQPKEYRFESGSTKLTGDIPKFSTLIEMDGTNEYYYDGTQWVLM
jgi:hypothetical protein